MDKLKLKLISDGTSEGTYLVDEEGKVLDGVLSIKWGLNATEVPTVEVTLVAIPVKISYETIKGNHLKELRDALEGL